MGGAVSAGEDNDDLVDNLKEADYIKTPLIERVFRAVDRGRYYLDGHKDAAYRDTAWKHGALHLSAPCIYSEVMENLVFQPGVSFLNIGSGTGYLSTMVGLVLGANGINHGIELHQEAIDYAMKKLDEYKREAEHFDDFEFCEPKYIEGNCLHLPPDTRRYDRIYCGAACPPEYETFLKMFVNIGGLLVMPLGDQLIQYKRVSETQWETKNILPVSFATLVVPESNQLDSNYVKLPELNPLSLQELCRFKIRAKIREKLCEEHSDEYLQQHYRVKKRKKKEKTRKNLRNNRIRVVPIDIGMVILGTFSEFEREAAEAAELAEAAEEEAAVTEVVESAEHSDAEEVGGEQQEAAVAEEGVKELDESDLIEEASGCDATSSANKRCSSDSSGVSSSPENCSEYRERAKSREASECEGNLTDYSGYSSSFSASSSKDADRLEGRPQDCVASGSDACLTKMDEFHAEGPYVPFGKTEKPTGSDSDDEMDSVDEATVFKRPNYIRDRVQQLPVPPALKQYLLYYRAK